MSSTADSDCGRGIRRALSRLSRPVKFPLTHHRSRVLKEAGMSDSHDELDYAGGGLPQETNWWGAFVIGLAGTILVTGIAPVMVTQMGAASIPSIVIITLSGWLLCLFL